MEESYDLLENFELKYILENNSHLMNALVQNKTEKEFIKIVLEISELFNLDIEILTEPLQEGSIKRFFKFKFNKKDIKDIQKDVLKNTIGGLALYVLITSISSDNLLEDKDYIFLKNNEVRLNIQHLENELKKDENYEQAQKIKKAKSNFYEALSHEERLNKISFNNEIIIDKSEFKDFIIVTDVVEPIIIEETLVEIIAPVLKKGNYKWKGIFDSEVITFYMKDKEFKESVQDSQIEFKAGFTIKSNMIINRKIDNDGEIKVKGYEITEVYEYSVNTTYVETRQGRKSKLENKSSEEQTRLDYYNEKNENEKK